MLFHTAFVARARDEVGRYCRDCSVDVIAIGEYFMVNARAWPVEPDGGVLCVGCLEARLGRTLARADFADCPLNAIPGSSTRLRARLANWS